MRHADADDRERVSIFKADAQAYCEFIDALRQDTPQDLYTTLLQLLSNLAQSAPALPFDMADKKVDDVERPDHEYWSRVAGDVAKATAREADALMAEHETGDEWDLIRSSMLWDDLADIYRDLQYGRDLYTVGDRDHTAHAVWHWRFSYESHWGSHLLRALMTVHEIRYRLYED